jgi:hypothetical protein
VSVVLLTFASPVSVGEVATLPIYGITVAKGLECGNVDSGELPGFEVGARSFTNAFAWDLSCLAIQIANFTDTLILLLGDAKDVTPCRLSAMGRSIEFDVHSDRLKVK